MFRAMLAYEVVRLISQLLLKRVLPERRGQPKSVPLKQAEFDFKRVERGLDLEDRMMSPVLFSRRVADKVKDIQ